MNFILLHLLVSFVAGKMPISPCKWVILEYANNCYLELTDVEAVFTAFYFL